MFKISLEHSTHGLFIKQESADGRLVDIHLVHDNTKQGLLLEKYSANNQEMHVHGVSPSPFFKWIQSKGVFNTLNWEQLGTELLVFFSPKSYNL